MFLTSKNTIHKYCHPWVILRNANDFYFRSKDSALYLKCYRLHQPVKKTISANSNILWNSPSLRINPDTGDPDFSKDYSYLSFKREKKGVIYLLFRV